MDEWLEEVRKYTPSDIKICLVGNKDDLTAQKEVPTVVGEVDYK